MQVSVLVFTQSIRRQLTQYLSCGQRWRNRKIWKPQSISRANVSLNDGQDHLQLNMLTPKTDFILAKIIAVRWRNTKRLGSHHPKVTGALVSETSDCTVNALLWWLAMHACLQEIQVCRTIAEPAQ